MIAAERIEHALKEAAGYIVNRQCHNGGFCYYRYLNLEEPNLHDTYYAVAACEVLQQEPPHPDRITTYLRSMQTAGRQSSYLYYLGFTARRLGAQDVLNQTFLDHVKALSIHPPSIDHNVLLSEWLEDSLRILRLQKTFAGGAAAGSVVEVIRALLQQSGAGATANLRDTYLALRILAELGGLAGLNKTYAFIERLQVPGLGFRYTESAFADSDIDTLYAGVFSCALLGLGLRYAEDILATVLSCQRRHGGFARASDSLGNLNTHYKALRIIQQLWVNPAADGEG